MSSTFILLPGLHGTSDLFAPLLAVIPANINTQSIEYPRNCTANYNDLLSLLETQLANQTDLVLVAESFSGPLALNFAAANPVRVRAVILCASFISNPVPRIFSYLGAPLALLRTPIPTFAIKLFLTGRHAPRSLIHNLRRTLRTVSPHVLAHRVLLASTINVTNALKNCPAPILCLAATRDRLIGRRNTQIIRRTRPDISIKSLDAPHLLLQLQPQQVWHEITQFLTTLPNIPG